MRFTLFYLILQVCNNASMFTNLAYIYITLCVIRNMYLVELQMCFKSAHSVPKLSTLLHCVTSLRIAYDGPGGPSKATVTPGLRPGYDLTATEKWANRRTIVRLVSEVVRLVAEVVGDRKWQISRNKVDGHVQNLKTAIPNRKRSHD